MLIADPIYAQQLCNWADDVLRRITRTKVNKAKTVTLPSEEDVFNRMLIDISRYLTVYENGPQTVTYVGVLKDGENFSEWDFNRTLQYRSFLDCYSTQADLVSLLVKKEQGRLYAYYYANVLGWGMTWDGFCTQYLGSARTANRYIDLYNLLHYYPRLAVCKLSMDAILRFKERLWKCLPVNLNLGSRLGEPLVRTKIELSVNLSAGQYQAPPSGVDLLSERSRMAGGWQTEDAILDGVETGVVPPQQVSAVYGDDQCVVCHGNCTRRTVCGHALCTPCEAGIRVAQEQANTDNNDDGDARCPNCRHILNAPMSM